MKRKTPKATEQNIAIVLIMRSFAEHLTKEADSILDAWGMTDRSVSSKYVKLPNESLSKVIQAITLRLLSAQNSEQLEDFVKALEILADSRSVVTTLESWTEIQENIAIKNQMIDDLKEEIEKLKKCVTESKPSRKSKNVQ